MTMTAKLTHTPHGIKMATITGGNRTPPEARGIITGWNKDMARRNRDFLQSIDPSRLTGLPVVYTATIRDTPATAQDWARLVHNWRKRLARLGSIRDHWVVEWQRRGTPHLHGMAFFDPATFFDPHASRAHKWLSRNGGFDGSPEAVAFLARGYADAMRDHWLRVAEPYRAGIRGQRFEPAHGLTGWLAYLSKHASRGVEHYQRQRHQLPDGWQSSGRLWGKGGDWPTIEASWSIDARTQFRLRRALRRYGRSKALTQLRLGQHYCNRHQIDEAMRTLAYLRRVGHSTAETPAEKKRWSALRGVNVFIPERAGQELIEWAIDHDRASVTDGRVIRDRVELG
jgi:hypothetical protein